MNALPQPPREERVFFATYSGQVSEKTNATVFSVRWVGAGAQEALFRYLAKGRKAVAR